MKLERNTIGLFFGILFLASCSQQQARRPVSQSSGQFMKESAERNKLIIAKEEKRIDSIMKSHPENNYIASKKGYWYCYETKNETDTLRPKKGDVAYFEYELIALNGALIYSKEELKPQQYHVDKQNIMMGLRDGIKLMHKNEKVVFLFTSHMGFGYHGDNKKIGINEPLMCAVTLTDIVPSTESK